MRRRLPVLLAVAALTAAVVAPAAALVGPPENDGAVADLGLFGEIGDVTTLGQATGLGTGRPSATAPTREYVLRSSIPMDPVIPESIAFDPLTGSYFTASTLTGAIYKGRLGSDYAEQFRPPVDGLRLLRQGVEVHDGTLYVVAAGQGTIDAFDTRTGAPRGTWETGAGGNLNDLVVDGAGDLYVTDSVRPVLLRIRAAALRAGSGVAESIPLQPAIQFDTTSRVNGVFNLNGIVTTGPGEFVIGKTNTDQLYRVVVDRSVPRVRTVLPVRLAGAITAPDGMELVGDRLFVVNNLTNTLVEVALSADKRAGRVVGRTTDPTFSTATGVARAGDRLLVSNSQLFTVPMVTPATVSSIRIPRAVVRR